MFEPAGPFPAAIVEELVVEADIPFTATVQCGESECQVPLDALAPDGSDLPPTFVLLPGGPVGFAGRRYMDEFAAAIAQREAIVFLASYRSRATGETEAESLLDIRCAVRFARQNTINYGGDPDNVVLVGHSFGSLLAIQMGVNNDSDTPDCLTGGDGVPEAVVGLSSFNASVTGDANSGPRMLLLGGSLDPQSQPGAETAQNLVDAGFDAEYRELDGVTHESMVDPATPGVLDALINAAIPDGAI